MTAKDEARIREFDMAERAYWLKKHGQGRINSVRRTFRYLWIERRKEPYLLDKIEILTVACHIAKRSDRWEMQIVARQDPERNTIHLSNIDYHGIAGWVVYWPNEPGHYTAGYVRHASAYSDEWKMGGGLSFPDAPVINIETLEGSMFEHCGWSENSPVCLIDYLHLYALDRRIEFLAKSGMWELVSPAGISRLASNRAFGPWCRNHANEIRSGYWDLREIIYSNKNKCSLADARAHFEALQHFRGSPLPKRLNPQARHILRYIAKNGIDHREYSRYANHAQTAGWNIADEHITYPPAKHFKALLERVEAAAHEVTRRKEIKKRSAVTRNIANAAKRFDFGKSGRSGTLSAVLPKCIADLKCEGRQMDNCIGRMGYDMKIAQGESLVIFIRNRGKPYADCEISLKGIPAIRQLYAKGNLPTTQAVKRFANSLLKNVRKTLRGKRNAG